LFSCKPSEKLLQKKKIQTTTFKEDCVVVLEDVSPSLNRTYFWYKSNEIHQSKGDYAGDLLHGNYVRHYITNELAEKGDFSYGLKKGEWKNWYKNGSLKSISNWKRGALSGEYFLHNDSGELLLKGRYSKGEKVGKWVDYREKDTIRYKKGVVILKKGKDTNAVKKDGFFRRLFKKKSNDESIKVQSVKTAKPYDEKTKKAPFLKRVFRKKKMSTNVKG
jgi:antitoxin component YwqK of YwqJK toxin-antitoxin module